MGSVLNTQTPKFVFKVEDEKNETPLLPLFARLHLNAAHVAKPNLALKSRLFRLTLAPIGPIVFQSPQNGLSLRPSAELRRRNAPEVQPPRTVIRDLRG